MDSGPTPPVPTAIPPSVIQAADTAAQEADPVFACPGIPVTTAELLVGSPVRVSYRNSSGEPPADYEMGLNCDLRGPEGKLNLNIESSGSQMLYEVNRVAPPDGSVSQGRFRIDGGGLGWGAAGRAGEGSLFACGTTTEPPPALIISTNNNQDLVGDDPGADLANLTASLAAYLCTGQTLPGGNSLLPVDDTP